MKHLHYVELANFKRYGETQRIELDHPAVLIGPNNCGKTSVLQAIALWSIGLRTWNPKSAGNWTPSPSFFSPHEWESGDLARGAEHQQTIAQGVSRGLKR